MNVHYLSALRNHCDRMVVGYTTTCSISTTISPRFLCFFFRLAGAVGQVEEKVIGRQRNLGLHHDITEIMLKVALNTIALTLAFNT